MIDNDGVNDGVNDGEQEATKKRPRNDHEVSKNQEEMFLNNQITIRELSKKLQYGSTKIKSDIKYLRENEIVSRTGSTKSGFWVVKK